MLFPEEDIIQGAAGDDVPVAEQPGLSLVGIANRLEVQQVIWIRFQ